MNRSRYVNRQIDEIDRAIIAALTKDGRITIRELAEQIAMSSPSVAERILKLKDAGAIQGYAVLINHKVFGLGTSAYVRLNAMPGQVKKLEMMLADSPEVVEADRVTGQDCFIAKVVVHDEHDLQSVVDRFVAFASTDTSIIQSSPVVRRLPKL